MLTNIWILTLGTLVALVVFWSIPVQNPTLRRNSLTVISGALVLLYSFGGFLICLVLILIPLAAQAAFSRKRNAWMFWIFVTLAATPLTGLRLLTDYSFLLSFGVAFATVKSIGLVLLAYAGRARLRPGDIALLIYFFPLFTVGPVERLNTFTPDNFGNRCETRKLLKGFYRIVTGLFLIMFVCNNILEPMRDHWFGRSLADIESLTRDRALGLIVTSFLYTYINLEGFSSVAIGLSRLFGLVVVENFDRPLLASNIALFWKRYHISMGNWINQNIFFPLVIWLKRPWATYVATVTAFVMFGIWHAFTLNYLVWGLGNGLGIALVHFGVNMKLLPLIRNPGALKFGVGCLTGTVTLIYIGWLQTFANLESFDASLTLTWRLVFG